MDEQEQEIREKNKVGLRSLKNRALIAGTLGGALQLLPVDRAIEDVAYLLCLLDTERKRPRIVSVVKRPDLVIGEDEDS